jgi:hypothetical protein
MIVALLAGMLFGVGLAVSGMVNPAKVVGFLDVAGGEWDPTLIFVMGGALLVTIPAFRMILKRARPILAGGFGTAVQERRRPARARRRHTVWRGLGVIGVLSWAGGGGDGHGALASVCVRRGDGGGMAIYTWIFERPHRGDVKTSRRLPKTADA